MDAEVLANELIEFRIKSKRPGIAWKLDHVNQEFLLKILKHVDFEMKWINWIRFCISNVNFLFDQWESGGFFNSQRVLRQGDTMHLLYSC